MRDIYKCNLRLIPACLHYACTRNRGTVAGSRPLYASSIICKSRARQSHLPPQPLGGVNPASAQRRPTSAHNLSLPSPNQGTHSHEKVAPRPNADAAVHPSGREDAAVVTGASPQLTVRQPPVPAKVKQRILRGEFVDFDNLLPEALYPARHGASPSPSFALRLSTDPAADGEMVIAQQKPASCRAVRDLASWLEAWNVYITVLVAHYPARAPPLLAYQRIICDASLRFPTSCWLRYDARFRACAAEDKSLRWDTKQRPVAGVLYPLPHNQASSRSHQRRQTGRERCT